MSSPVEKQQILETNIGDFPLDEYRFGQTNREWKILHATAVLSHEDEYLYLSETENRLPYGVVLWTAGIALAHELATRGDSLKGKTILELGAGTGLPGIVAASFGAKVSQTDRNNLVLTLCKRNCELNNLQTEAVLADWMDWKISGKYDYILGSDILYSEEMHASLNRIFENNLADGGRILLSDPFRATSIKFLEEMETKGWQVTFSKWNVENQNSKRDIAVFELSRD